MASQLPLETLGVVEDVLGSGRFRVRVSLGEGAEHVINCYASGKMRMNKISIIKGDKVKVEVPPPYTMGRIVFREK